ncbi:hypothetical protein FRC18_004131 [Serendipita sp. 400]|nr:hypothetical protein FRC18_004131 [Serendipita sp. 400]
MMHNHFVTQAAGSDNQEPGEAGTQVERETQNIKYKLSGDKIISHDPLLSRDVPSLSYFLRAHGSMKPNHWLSIRGTHSETRTRTVYRDGRAETETYEDTIVDFDFNIDLSHLLELDPIFYTVADNVPAYRGSMRMATEENGPTNTEGRRLVSSDEKSAQKRWLKESRRLGLPPWMIPPSHQTGERGTEQATSQSPPSRTIENWLADYCASQRTIKDFKLRKVVYGWNQDALTQSIHELIWSTGYQHEQPGASVFIKFHSSPTSVHVRSSSFVSKIFSSWILIALFSLILVFPFLWLWRRYWPEAGGKWGVSGVGFPLKRWELLGGTFPGDTVEAARARLSATPGSQAEAFKRLQAGLGGVWVLQGTHEGDWFRAWEYTIRLAVRDRQGGWLTRQVYDRVHPNVLASQLDRL